MQKRLSPKAMLLILFGLNLFNYLDRLVMSGVLTPLKEDLHLSDGQLGRIVTCFMVGYFLTSPFFGYLGDRLSRKWLIAGGIFVWSLGTVLTGMATGFVWLLSFRVLVGLGEASYGTTSPGLISDSFPPAKRNSALTIFSVAMPVGAALGYILGGQVAAHFGWRYAFYFAGVPGLFLALVLLPFREPRRGESEGKADAPEFQKKPSLRDVANLMRIPDFNLVCWGYTFYTFAMGAYAFWAPTFLVRVHHMPNARASTFIGAMLVVAGLLGTLIGGFGATALQKHNSAGYAWILGVSALLAAPVCVFAFLTPDTTLSMVALAVAIFLMFLSAGPVNTLVIESVPVNLRSSAMALCIFMIHFFGDMWSSEIVGRLADYWGNLQRGLLLLPAALGVGALFWLALAVKTERNRLSTKSSSI